MSWTRKADVLAVIISAMALAVSGLTWLDVRKQLRLASGQVRSYVQVVDAELKEPLSGSSMVRIELRLKNFGQTAAVDVYGEMEYHVGMPVNKKGGNSATRRQFGAMGPGMERTVTLVSNRYQKDDWPAATKGRYYETIFFYGTVWFTDETTQEGRKEDWCYELPLKSENDLNRIDLDRCDILMYKSGAK
jgi:hypothetical protein